MNIYQISVFIENKPGRLTEVVDILAKNSIDIRALSIADTTDFGILRLIVSDPEKAIEVLRADGITVTKTRVIGVALADEPGALSKVLTILNNAGIALEYAYAFITHSKSNACVVLRVEDNDAAIKVLSENGVSFVEGIE